MKKRQRTRNEVLAFIASFIVLLALLAVAVLGMNQKVSSLQADIQNLNAQKAKYTKIINEIKKLEKDREALMAKIDAIKKLKSTSQATVRILDEVTSSTPPDSIWLTSLKQSGQTVALTGVALDNTRIADYMDSLTASPYVASATLGKSALTVIAGQKLKSFSLNLAVQTPKKDEKTDSNQGTVK